MVGLDTVVGVLLGSMPRCRQEFLQHGRVRRGSVGDHLNGEHLGRADGPLKASAGYLDVAPWGDERVDDLPELIDRAVDLAPLPRHPHLRLAHRPAIARRRGDTGGQPRPAAA
jgi:hypothetical protein